MASTGSYGTTDVGAETRRTLCLDECSAAELLKLSRRAGVSERKALAELLIDRLRQPVNEEPIEDESEAPSSFDAWEPVPTAPTTDTHPQPPAEAMVVEAPPRWTPPAKNRPPVGCPGTDPFESCDFGCGTFRCGGATSPHAPTQRGRPCTSSAPASSVIVPIGRTRGRVATRHNAHRAYRSRSRCGSAQSTARDWRCVGRSTREIASGQHTAESSERRGACGGTQVLRRCVDTR